MVVCLITAQLLSLEDFNCKLHLNLMSLTQLPIEYVVMYLPMFIPEVYFQEFVVRNSLGMN